ncbi:CAP domain-containing protein [Alkalibacillus aidingensis]|uniref:CAP domain-containing protein n=1 Tax=Alkalibacillus aidingensis TaxID=2747607 RepID=UPI001660417A|nr:CAP domain-containing protein [Alkalibacillus aidingensis]
MRVIKTLVLVGAIIFTINVVPFNQLTSSQVEGQHEDESQLNSGLVDDFMERMSEVDLTHMVSYAINTFDQIAVTFSQMNESESESAPVTQSEDPSKVESEVEVSDFDALEFEEQVHTLVNEERDKEGLSPLDFSDEISVVAREKSNDMAANDYFDHQSPTYGSPFEMMDHYGLEYRAAGENIAMGQRSPEQVMDGWMNSEGHRENILNDTFTHIGVGFVQEGYQTYWTQMFVGK